MLTKTVNPRINLILVSEFHSKKQYDDTVSLTFTECVKMRL